MGNGARTLLYLVAAISQANAAFAADPSSSAKALLENIYSHYVGKDSKGVPFQSKAQLEAIFTRELAQLMSDDMTAAAKRGEVGNLDGDPFINAQDWEIDSFAVEVRA